MPIFKSNKNGSDVRLDCMVNVDSSLDPTSKNPIQNKVVAEEINTANENISSNSQKIEENKNAIVELSDRIDSIPDSVTVSVDSSLDSTSENPVQNKVITEKFNTVEESMSSNSQKIEENKTAIEELTNTVNNIPSTGNVGIASTNNAGIVKPDGETITIDEDGTIHSNGTTTNINVDDCMSETSENPVQNKVVTAEINFNKIKYFETQKELDDAIKAGEITDGEYFALKEDSTSSTPSYVPDGDTVEPINDVATWLSCGDVNKDYTELSQVIEDDITIHTLFMDENAMKYLARSAGFADELCANETAMTFLGMSDYVDGTLLNSDIWKQYIKASQYWTLVYASKTVTVYGAASETITIDGYYGSFTTGTDGSCSHVVPIDTITLTGSVSGQSFVSTVTSETTKVYVMPEGALYWYGNSFANIIEVNPSTYSTKVYKRSDYIECIEKWGGSTLKFVDKTFDTTNKKIKIIISGTTGLTDSSRYSMIAWSSTLITTDNGGNINNSESSIRIESGTYSNTQISYVVSLTGDKYFAIGVYGNNTSANPDVLKIHAIWLE